MLGIANVSEAQEHGPTMRVPCERCQYAVWRYGLDKLVDGQSVRKNAVLVEHVIDVANASVERTVISTEPFGSMMDLGWGGTLVDDPEGLLRHALRVWSDRGAGEGRYEQADARP